jgi:phenylacetate-CoA ligase
MKRAFSRKNLWENLPRPMKTIAAQAIGLFPIPLLLGKKYRDNFKFVEEAQWWSEEKLKSYQLEKLKDICTFAVEKSPFYKKHFSLAGLNPSQINDL